MDVRSISIFKIEKPKRKSANRKVKEAKAELIKLIMSDLRDGKRNIPKDWERGFLSAMSIVARFEDD